MVLNCPQCESRLQIDDAKMPSQPFKIRCPKCTASVSVPVEESVATDTTEPEVPFQRPKSAPLFNAPNTPNQPAASSTDGNLDDFAVVLAEAMQKAGGVGSVRAGKLKRPKWDPRKVLVCSSPAYRDRIAQMFADNDYEVYVAEGLGQALGRMKEDRMDVLILDANFDPLEQGVAFVTREVKLMRPLERRRLFVVYLSTSVRTMDLHAAFLHNVNLVINPSDIDQLIDAVDVSLRHFNELYRNFNQALEVAPT